MIDDNYGDIETLGLDRERFAVSFESDTYEGVLDEQVVFLYVPNKEEFEHFHIPVDIPEACKLRDWLIKVLPR